jgi:hypothetical protein
MAAVPAPMLQLLVMLAAAGTAVQAQTVAPASTRVASVAPSSSSHATPVWTLKMKQDFRWQQVTPSGTLLVSTDAA